MKELDSDGWVEIRWPSGVVNSYRVRSHKDLRIAGDSSGTAAATTAAALADPDSPAYGQCRWDPASKKGSSMSVDGNSARCPSGKGAVLGMDGASAGLLQWSVDTFDHPKGDEAVCLGVGQKPFSSESFDSEANKVTHVRAFSGEVMVNGSVAPAVDGTPRSKLKFSPGERVQFALDLRGPDGILMMRTPRRSCVISQAITKGPKWYPAAFTYGKGRLCLKTLSEIAEVPDDGALAASSAKVGSLVTRGPEWASGVEDGGHGAVGTVVEVKSDRVVVEWSGKPGRFEHCKEGKKDLLLFGSCLPES